MSGQSKQRQARVGSQKYLTLPTFDLADALCAQTDPELFFPNTKDNSYSHLAKKICSTCTVRLDCLEWALTNKEEHGIWGGFTPSERERMSRLGRNKLKSVPIRTVRGAPPKDGRS
jgi:WhiB family redox-sensing transcriptional regulator